jgi:hypothetical protein
MDGVLKMLDRLRKRQNGGLDRAAFASFALIIARVEGLSKKQAVKILQDAYEDKPGEEGCRFVSLVTGKLCDGTDVCENGYCEGHCEQWCKIEGANCD